MLDVIVIGAGVTGIYALHRLRSMGLSVRVFDGASGVGGTWYANHYPGCRFDSETISYCYSFSEELLQDWDWKERYSAQPDTLAYLNHVVDRFDLRKDIVLNERIAEANYNATDSVWTVRTVKGATTTARYLVTALGILSTPTMPNIPGMATFKGISFHTSNWPGTSFSLEGRRVAVIGTGATGIQIIQEASKIASQVTVLQRDPTWVSPLRNSKITPDEMAEIKAQWPAIFERCASTMTGFIHGPDPRKTFDLTPEEREAFYEELYNTPGFAIWMGNFHDIFVDEAAAQELTNFIEKKMRARINDQSVADKLIPTDHLFGMRRVPLETNYLEVYNQDNVSLVDLRKSSIERITPDGLIVDGVEMAFDTIIYATGYDAILGGYNGINFVGVGGVTLKDKWADGPLTYIGLQTPGLPNLFTLVGPQSGASFTNFTRGAESAVNYLADLLTYAGEHGFNRIEADAEAADRWVDRAERSMEPLLLSKVDSWYTAVNPNLSRKRQTLLYAGGQTEFREVAADIARDNYRGFNMTTT